MIQWFLAYTWILGQLDVDSESSDIEGEDKRRDISSAADPGDEDLDHLNQPRFRGPFAAAIGLVSRMATGLLRLRGNNREQPNGWNAQGRTKHGLEEILDDDEAGSSRDLSHVVDRLRKLDPSSNGRLFWFLVFVYMQFIIFIIIVQGSILDFFLKWR